MLSRFPQPSIADTHVEPHRTGSTFSSILARHTSGRIGYRKVSKLEGSSLRWRLLDEGKGFMLRNAYFVDMFRKHNHNMFI
jgi:hypothetical protein